MHSRKISSSIICRAHSYQEMWCLFLPHLLTHHGRSQLVPQDVSYRIALALEISNFRARFSSRHYRSKNLILLMLADVIRLRQPAKNKNANYTDRHKCQKYQCFLVSTFPPLIVSKGRLIMLEVCQVTMKSGQESWLLLMCSVDKWQLSEKPSS